MSILWAIGGFLIVLTPIVLVHELGHFVAARLSNIEVEEFGFGLPPRALIIAKRGGTIFSLNWIPLGGFVRPAGEDDPSVLGGLSGASKRARLFVLSAGAAANFIMAFFVFWISYMIGPPAIAVAMVVPDSPAEAAGLLSGDLIMQANDEYVETSGGLAALMREEAGNPVSLLIERENEEILVLLTPRLPDEYDSAVDGPVGITIGYSDSGERLSRGVGESAVLAVTSITDYIELFFRMPMMLISGELTAAEARPISVVGISQIAGQAAEASVFLGNVYPILDMIAFISIALGLTNLLPIPALDGGRILFVLIEAVRGKRIEAEKEGMVHMVGMMLLLGLMLFMIVQDVVNPIIPF